MDATPDILAIFNEALAQKSDEERLNYLDKVCGDDQELQRRLYSLLQAHQDAGQFLGGSVTAVNAHDAPLIELRGTVIGPYKLLEQIGEGGFGAVYMAEQTQPVRRKVALKIIKPGMDTRQVVARFEAERQALALMDHPNIAKVHDAGTTEHGRPYFVMELVHGVPITTFCDSQKLTPDERLKLFVDVCRAVQHAHQKGIIHRDLKPSNVMVTMHDDKAIPKVIDFGVSKATSQQLTEKTLFTGYGQMVGTPMYMSPEQAQLSGLDVDTRSDVYSLGVLLYALITGTTPFDEATLKHVGFDEMRRMIREVDPPRPSERVSTLRNDLLSTVADQRQVDPRKLSQTLRGELDWIVMKCLEKDRARRYESANSLAADIERYLNEEPVEACPPSTTYRIRKFAKRNRGPVVAATFITIVLLGGIIASTWQAVRAIQAEHDQVAQRKRSEEVSKFLVSAFRSPDPARHDGRTITIAEVLDRSTQEIHDALPDDPGTKAALLGAIGESYIGLGLNGDAIPLLEKARELRDGAPGIGDVETLSGMALLAEAYRRVGQLEKSLPLFEETLGLSNTKLGPNHVNTVFWMCNLADAYRSAGQTEKAMALNQEAFERCKTRLGPDHHRTLAMMGTLAHAHRSMGRLDEAIPLLERTLKRMETVLGHDHPHTVTSMRNLANMYDEAGRLEEAIGLYEESLKLDRAKYPPDHPNVLDKLNCLAAVYDKVGRSDDASELLSEARQLSESKLGPEHPGTIEAIFNLAATYYNAGRLDKAIPLYEEILQLQKAKLGSTHPDTLATINNLAEAYVDNGTIGGALSPKEADHLLADILTPAIENQPTNFGLLRYRGDLLARTKRWKEAVADFSKAIEIEPENHETYHSLAPLLVHSGDADAYRRHCNQVLERFGNTGDPITAERMAKDCLILPPSPAELEDISKMVDVAIAAGESNWAWTFCQFAKGLCEYRHGRFADSVQWMQKVAAKSGDLEVLDAQTHLVLAMAQRQSGQSDEARVALARATAIIEAKAPLTDSVLIEPAWSDWFIAHALLREAKALIDSSRGQDSS